MENSGFQPHLEPSQSPGTDPGIGDDLTEAVQSFGDIQAELNYRQAQDVLRELVGKLDLSPRERSGLEAEIHSLETMLDKLDRQVVHIAVFGMVGRGKSSLLNALLGQTVFETGPTHGVTQTIQQAEWQSEWQPQSQLHSHAQLHLHSQWQSEAIGTNQVRRLTLPSGGSSQIELIDTPGIDEVDGETREQLAKAIAERADLILFVVAGDMTKVEYEALSQLRQASKPMLLVFNKIDQYPAADRIAIYEKIRDDRVKELLSPNEIVMAAAAPLLARAIKQADGRIVAKLQPATPQVDDLKLKILEVLHREGKSLVALNSMLYADLVNEQLVQRKLTIREHNASQVIWNATMTKAIAVAINPVTVIDLLSGAVIDIAMILTLSKLYGIAMTQKGAVGLLQKIAIGMGGITASELIATLGLGSLKSLLGAAVPATGGLSATPYISVALAQAGVAGVSSYAIGQVAKVYLANGASWGEETPKAVVGRILSSLDEASILSRIKDELRSKVDMRRF